MVEQVEYREQVVLQYIGVRDLHAFPDAPLDRNADVGRRESARVIEPVPDHHRAARLPDDRGFHFRRLLGEYVREGNIQLAGYLPYVRIPVP